MINSLLFFAKIGDKCSLGGGGLLSFPHWYGYLSGQVDGTGHCAPRITGINDLWLVVAAIIEILLRIAGIAAVIFVIYGGIAFITSEGEPSKAASARSTAINALVGLAIAVMAGTIIAFVAKSIS